MPLFNFEEGYKNSTKENPILLITAPGSDPVNEIKVFAYKEGKELRMLSLGQGQDKFAIANFNRCSEEGFWLMYQNTHL